MAQADNSNAASKSKNIGLFSKDDLRRLLKNKKVVIIGDSVYRSLYKDIIVALQEDRLLEENEMKSKIKPSFPEQLSENCEQDKLIYNNSRHNGHSCAEVREYQSQCGFYLIQYYYVTRCYYMRIEALLKDFVKELPDVVIMNSCLWDTTRYGEGEYCMEEYLKNMNFLLTRLHEILPPSAIFLWCTCLPLASQFKCGLTLDQELSGHRTVILEANFKIAQLVTSFGFNVLDLHYYMRSLLKHRVADGVHWDSWAQRHITELVLAFLCDTWGLPLPPKALEKLQCYKSSDEEKGTLPHLSIEGVPKFVEMLKKECEHEQKRQHT